MVTPPGLEPGTNSTKNCCATDYTTGYRAQSLAMRVTKSTPGRIETSGPEIEAVPLAIYPATTPNAARVTVRR